jgi:hypothetical protein
LRRKSTIIQLDDAVDPLWKVLVHGNDFKPFAGEADVYDNGDSHAEFDVSLDDFPSTHFKADFIGQAVMQKHHFHLWEGGARFNVQDAWTDAHMLRGRTVKMNSPLGDLYVTINEDEQGRANRLFPLDKGALKNPLAIANPPSLVGLRK